MGDSAQEISFPFGHVESSKGGTNLYALATEKMGGKKMDDESSVYFIFYRTSFCRSGSTQARRLLAADELRKGRSLESPTGGECVGGFFNVSYFSPAAISQVCVCELVGDDVQSEILRCLLKLATEHHTAADRVGS